jgi:hypothetical protein
MKIRSLYEIDNLPMSTLQKDIDERIEAIFDFIERDGNASIVEIAEAFVDVISFQSYAGHFRKEHELNLVLWIDTTFDEKNERYIDAVAAVYANMRQQTSFNNLNEMHKKSSSTMVKRYLKQAIDEFEVHI